MTRRSRRPLSYAAAAVAACLAFGAAPPARAAGGLQAYLGVANRYRAGDTAWAVREIRSWYLAEVWQAVDQLVRRSDALRQRQTDPEEIDLRTVEAAILLHVQVAFLADASPAEEAYHLDAAGRVFRWMDALASRRRAARSRLEQTGEQDPARVADALHPLDPHLEPGDFYAALAAGTLASWALPTAEKLAKEGLKRLPADATMQLVAGCVQESVAADASTLGRDGEARRALERAEKRLRDALAVDDTRLEARLRLGRVLLLQGRTTEAELPLETVARDTTDDRLRYLAWLFLGRLHDGRRDPEQAIDAYQRALGIRPDGQAARIGLVWAEDRLSGPAVAHLLLLEGFGRPRDPDSAGDPWWNYFFGPPGLAEAAIGRMRDTVLRP